MYTVTLLLSALLCWVTPSVEAGRKCIDCTWSIKVSGADDACTKDDVSKLGLLTIGETYLNASVFSCAVASP